MILALWIALLILVALLVVVAAAVVLPLHIELRAARDGAFRFNVVLRPFGGLGPRISLSDRKEKPAKRPRKRTRKSRKPSRLRREPRIVLHAALRLLMEIFALVRLHRANLSLRFGSGGPGETGQIYGMLMPAIHGLGGASRANIHVEPVFDRAVLTGRALVDLSITPALLLPPFLRFGWVLFGPAR